MNIAGIIAEFNPFHYGHRYLLEQARARCGAQYVVCVMSASFVQRGEPALHDKFARTAAALAAGADMVLELPCAYSLQAAPFFARGAVGTLNAAGIITHLVFGAEAPEQLTGSRIAPETFRARIDGGVSYARAAGDGLPELAQPNNLLGTEYLRALSALGSGITPVAIRREGAAHGNETDASFSATAARAFFAAGRAQEALSALPPEAAAQLRGPICLPEAAFVPLLCRLRTLSAAQLRDYAGISEGLEYRVLSAAEEAQSLQDLILRIKSKRYSFTRISRLLMSVLVGLTAEETARANEKTPYLRVLGVNRNAQELLSLLSDRAQAPVVIGVQDFLRTEAHPLLLRELCATDVHAALTEPAQPARRDKTAGLIVG